MDYRGDRLCVSERQVPLSELIVVDLFFFLVFFFSGILRERTDEFAHG